MEDFVTLDAAYKRMYGSSMTHFSQDPTPTSRMQQSNAWNVKLHWGANIESGEDFRNVVSITHRVLLGCWDATGSHWIRTTPPKKARNFQIASYVWSVFSFSHLRNHIQESPRKNVSLINPYVPWTSGDTTSWSVGWCIAAFPRMCGLLSSMAGNRTDPSKSFCNTIQVL